MAYHLTTRWGTAEPEPAVARMQEVLSQLDAEDFEHPDVSLTHDSEWCLGAYPSGVVVWENLETDDPPRHRKGVARERILELWIKLSQGCLEEIEAEPWLPGYGASE